MLSPIDCACESLAPLLAASMMPGPPPVMIAKPSLPSSRAVSSARRYSGSSRGVRAEPKIETAAPTCPSASKPMFTSSRIRSSRSVSLSVDATSSCSAAMISSSRVRGWRGSASAIRRLERERERLLEQLLDAREELRAVGAVEDAVVADERERHLLPRDHAAALVHRRLRGERADREDRGLRRVDDRGEALDTEHAEVRDREGAAGELGRGHLLLAHAFDQAARLARDRAERLLVGVEDRGDHERVLRRHCHAHVHVAVELELAVAVGAV